MPHGREDDEAAEQEEEEGRQRPTAYFPPALAKSSERPLDFNFELYLFDSLRLPRGLFPDDEDGPVEFSSLAECTGYCNRFVQQTLAEVEKHGTADDRASLAQDMRDRLDKGRMFRQSGTSLGRTMVTGNEAFDANLDDLRLDRFGNVMMLTAPPWSDISAQFMHGFPRRLVAEAHGGILPGNLTIAAKISNQAMRSLSTGDIAAFISRPMVQGLGLTRAELMLARTSAIKYAGKAEKPARLVDLMVRFGVDFLHLAPLTAAHIKQLRAGSSEHWNRVLSSDSSDSEASSSDASTDAEVELRTSLDTRAECEMLPERSSEEFNRVVTLTISNLFACFTGRAPTPATDPAPLPQGETAARPATARNTSHSGQRRRRTQPNTAAADSTASQPSTSQAEPAEVQPQLRSAREALLAMPGIVAIRIPSEQSLARLEEFLRNNQPITPEVSSQIELFLKGNCWFGIDHNNTHLHIYTQRLPSLQYSAC